MDAMNKKIWLGLGAVVSAVGASVCCILPVAVAILGFGSAAVGSLLEPFRPFLVGLTMVFLGVAFYQAYMPRKPECSSGGGCVDPMRRKQRRIALWIVAAFAVALITFPYYAGWLF